MGLSKEEALTIINALETRVNNLSDAHRCGMMILRTISEQGGTTEELNKIAGSIHGDSDNAYIGMRAACHLHKRAMSKADFSGDYDKPIDELRKNAQQRLGRLSAEFMACTNTSIAPWVKKCIGEAYDKICESRAILRDFEKDPLAFAGIQAAGSRTL